MADPLCLTPSASDPWTERPGDRKDWILRLELCVYSPDRVWTPGSEFIHPGILHVMDRDPEPLIFPSGALSQVAQEQRGVGGGAAAGSTLHILICAILDRTRLRDAPEMQGVLKWTSSDLRGRA